MPATAAGLNVNPNDPTQNIQGGLTYLQQLYNQFGDWNEALEAYNEGPGALQSQLSAGTIPVSAGYASGILSAAGMLDSSVTTSDTSDLGLTSPQDASDELLASLDSLSIGDVPGIAAVAGIVLLMGIGIFALT